MFAFLNPLSLLSMFVSLALKEGSWADPDGGGTPPPPTSLAPWS